MNITVQQLFQDKKDDLRLELVAGKEGLKRSIEAIEINRPGLALSGFLKYFPAERIQIVGYSEFAYLKSLKESLRFQVLSNVFSSKKTPAVIFTRRQEPFPEAKKVCDEYQLPLLVSALETSRLIGDITFYLEEHLGPKINLHGVLVEVYGIGVLIIGKSGIGKSECALELLRRGHMLVADDVVEVSLHSGYLLVGRSPLATRNIMEVRGIGIIEVQNVFGIGVVLDSTHLELVVKLEEWQNGKVFDRTGLDESTMEILGVKVPEVVLPVQPGRNLAILVEVAALNQRLKKIGYHSAHRFDERLRQIIGK